MKIKQDNIMQIFQGSEMHLLIIIVSCISAAFFVVLALFVRKINFSEKKVKGINYSLYAIGTIVALMMLFNPSIWYQYIFINKSGGFYKDTYDIVILFLNLFISVVLPYSYIAQNNSYKLIAFVSLPIIIIQIIDPSIVLFYSEIPNEFVNNISITGYVSYLIIYSGLATYNLINIIICKEKLSDCKKIFISFALLIPIIIPYILFSRSETFVPRDISNTIDLNSMQKGLVITQFSISHLFFVFGNIIIFFIYYYVVKRYIKKEYFYDSLMLLVTGLMFTVVCRRATYLFDNNLGFYLLPDSPCAIGVFVAYIALIFKSKHLTNYSVFVTFAFTTLNNLIMFQGGVNNFWNYLTMDSMFYHLYLSIIVFHMVKLDFFDPSKKLVFKSCVIFSIIYFAFALLGNIQSRVEYLTGLDLCSNKYVGFFYNVPAFKFLNDIVYRFGHVGAGFEILPINWGLTIGAAFGLAYISYFIYHFTNKCIRCKSVN